MVAMSSIDQALLGVDAAQRQNVAGEDARTFVDVVDDVDVVRIIFGDLGGCLAKARSEIAGLQVVGDDGGAVSLHVCLRIRLARGDLQPLGANCDSGKVLAPSIESAFTMSRGPSVM